MVPSRTGVAAPVHKPWYRHLYVWVLAGMLAGALVGLVAPDFGASLQVMGDVFIALLTMVIGPLMFVMIVSGIGAVGDLRGIGAVALRSIAYFQVTTVLALLFAVTAVTLVRPGDGLTIDVGQLDVSDEVSEASAEASTASWSDYVVEMFPENIVASFAEGELLHILIFAVLCGIGLATLGERGRSVARAVDRLGEVLFAIVRLVLYAAPFGVFGAMAYTVGHFGVDAIVSLLKLIGTFYGTSIAFVVVVLGGALLLVRLNPIHVVRYFKDEILLALGASSSEVALPGIVRKLTAVGVRRGTAGMSVSAGYSFNLDGQSIYIVLAGVFISQAVGIELGVGQLLLLLLLVMVMANGTGGVTGGGFVLLTVTLAAFPVIPVAGVMIVFGIDRFMSECRAVVNSFGNAVAGLVIARWQGEVTAAEVNAIMAGRVPAVAAEDHQQAEPVEPEPVGAR